MRKKKSTHNGLAAVLLTAALVGGGYYWLTSDSEEVDDTSKTSTVTFVDKEVQEEVNIPDASDSLIEQSLEIVEDTADIAPCVTPDVKQRTTPASRKNAYVDEYGNVIYTHPEKTQAIRYKTHSQGRWGYSFKYPSFLSQTAQSQNNDGSVFVNKQGVKLTSYGSWNVFNESVSELFQKDVPGARSVTYKRLFRKQRSYIKSGYTKNNQIYYMKEAIIGKDNQEVVVTLVLTYPKTYNQAEQIIKNIFPGFPIVNR